MSKELEALLRAHLQQHDGKSELLFVNRRGRAFSANKLRVKKRYPLLDELKIPSGGFHSIRHGAASSLLADSATPAVGQQQLRHSDARITLGIYGHVISDEHRSVVQNRDLRAFHLLWRSQTRFQGAADNRVLSRTCMLAGGRSTHSRGCED